MTDAQLCLAYWIGVVVWYFVAVCGGSDPRRDWFSYFFWPLWVVLFLVVYAWRFGAWVSRKIKRHGR